MFSLLTRLSLDTRLSRRLLFWTPIVLINAATPFFLADTGEYDLVARLCGILTWIVIALFGISWGYQRLQNPHWQKSIFIGYAIKTSIALLAIVGLIPQFIDYSLRGSIWSLLSGAETLLAMVIGIVSSSIGNGIFGVLQYLGAFSPEELSESLAAMWKFFTIYVVVIIHGVLTNLLILTIAAITLAVLQAIRKYQKPVK